MDREAHLRFVSGRIDQVCRELDRAMARCEQTCTSGARAADALDCRRLDRLNQELVDLVERLRRLAESPPDPSSGVSANRRTPDAWRRGNQ